MLSGTGLNISIPAGTKLGRYEIRSKLGAGGMGEVYLAEDSQLRRRVALKILPGDLASTQDRMRRFIQEAQAAAALNHPNIATIHEIGESDSVNFIAMEFIDGFTLRELIHGKQTEMSKLLRYLQHVAEGLAKAHSAGIVHRDLKPDNIMITREGHAKILDFGLAKLIEHRPMPGGDLSEIATAVIPQHSSPGTVMGTVGYMSPEQAQGKTKEIDQRSDIFSFGCILFEAATGKKPFEGDSVIKSLHMVVYEAALTISDLNPSAPPDLQRIVRRCLEKDPEERYQSIKEVAIELKQLRRELAGAAFDTTVPPPPKMDATGAPATENSSQQSLGASTSIPSTSLSTRASSAEYLISGIKRHKMIAAIVVLMIVVGAILVRWYFHARDTEGAIESIAVLPFVNQNHAPDSEYLSDGVTESIINSLTQLPNLKVIARSSVFRYKGKETDPLTAGKELGVRAVLTGRILQRGDNLTISTELLDVRDNKQLWGEQYSEKISDLLSVQREIASKITANLRLRLSGEQQNLVTKHYTDNPEAYQLYLKGRFYWNKRSADGFKKASEQFQQAVDKDPSFALAYVGLADSYSVMEQYAGVPSSEALPKARAAVLRALQIDDSLAEAHASLGLINEHSGQFADAEKEYKRAIELNPNYPTVHHWYALLLLLTGRFDDGMAEIKRAQQLDPLSAIIAANVGNHYFWRGDLNAASAEYKKAIELNPNLGLAHSFLGLTYLKQRREQEAMAELQKAVEVSGRASQELGVLGYGYGVMGKRAEAMAVLRELEEKYDRRESPGLYLAEVYAGLGEKDQAFAWLEKDFQARSSLLNVLTVFPLESLRDDPRYTDLLRRIGLRP
ncbi:MAG TPA: protein kinase [Pyrinomonadaceae bacterium]|jgi:serine/threonine-protein kinase|nr:protein kinase [Pyrinomonadaceae bacterium]